MEQVSGIAHRPVIKSKAKIGICQNNQCGNQNDQNKYNDCHPLFKVHTLLRQSLLTLSRHFVADFRNRVLNLS